MNFTEFTEFVRTHIREYLKETEETEIAIIPMNKADESYTGMIVGNSDRRFCPVINLERFYLMYRKGSDLGDLLRQMAEGTDVTFNEESMEWLRDYSQVRDQLFVRLSSREGKEILLKNVPYREYEDLVMTYHVFIADEERRLSSFMITEAILSGYGITEEQLHQDALANAAELFPVCFLNTRELIGEQDDDENGSFVIVTNTKQIYGASALFYPGVMEECAERMKGSYYVLPSSVHETLILPVEKEQDTDFLRGLVYDINRSTVDESDRLSDQIYLYNAKIGEFRLIPEECS